jgi:hypothetical protein
MSETYFPANTCVLACSGPSLNTIDPFSLGLPVVVISTAIRKVTNPNFWIIADYLNEMHGLEGSNAYSNKDIIKVVPEGKISVGANPQSVVLCKYDTSNRWPDLDSSLFTGTQPFIRGPHKSVTFGIQWLHYIGVKNVIWVGNDLKAKSMKEKYAYEVQEFDMKKAYNYDKTLDQTANALKSWYPIALKRGFQWFSWNCGEVFESFVPKFDLNWWESEGKEQLKQYAPITFPKIDNFQPVREVVEHKKENKTHVKIQKRSEVYEKPKKIESLPKANPIPLQELVKDNKIKPPPLTSERRDMRRKILDVKKSLRQTKK